MAYNYVQMEEAPNVKALKMLLREASDRAGAVYTKNPAEYARMMREVIAVAGQLAQAYDENARLCERSPLGVAGGELVVQPS
jgi:hypothetical protein